MNKLQYSRREPVSAESMQISIAALHAALPEKLRDQILILVDHVAHTWLTGAQESERYFKKALGNTFEKFENQEYIVWPILVDKDTSEDHWETAIIHMTTGKDNKRTHVSQIALIDPLKRHKPAQRSAMVLGRLTKILKYIAKFTIARDEDLWRDLWVPEQRFYNDKSDGPRAYQVCKTMMGRLLTVYETGIGYHEGLWDDLSGWFNEDDVRREMLGKHVWDAVENMGYNARPAVEAVSNVRRSPNQDWENAGDLMRPMAPIGEPLEPQRPDFPKRLGLHEFGASSSGDADANRTPKRPRFGPPPPSRPRIYPTYSLRKDDGLKEYNGWFNAEGRNPVWCDPRKIGPPPPLSTPPSPDRVLPRPQLGGIRGTKGSLW
ncbi:hypothetical protein DL769_004648 [Monosporascus sp. CRB-8-3]|nr:hypothetical protein DL769_004648 [Monosporascus sp. CRB-8-3]